MHFDQRTQRALREVGLDTEELRAASAAVVEAVEREAAALESVFDRYDRLHSDMDMAHSREPFPEHTVESLDVTTHGAEMRGWIRFSTWGVYVTDGRVLDSSTDYVELTLGPPIHDRVRFAPERDQLE